MSYNPQEAKQILDFHKREFGIDFGAVTFAEPEWKRDYTMAMDAQPQIVTTANNAIPQFLTAFLDPDILKVLTAKNAAVNILGEKRKGSFTDVTAIFPVVEHTGEVSSYGDFSQNGRAGANSSFPTREAYLYQVITEYGDLEMERQGLAKIGWANELKMAGINILNKFQNLTYFRGVAGLQNYGLLNDPSLSPAIAPAPKAYNSGTSGPWVTNGVVTATANEIYSDIQALYGLLVTQSAGNVSADTKMVLALSPKSEMALTTTNTFNVNVHDLIKKNFPNLRIESAVQYGALSASNPQGSALGEIVQLIAEEVEGQETGYCAFNEKLRASPIIRDLSSYKQKMTQGTWGCVIRQPFAVAQMLGT